MIWRSDFFYQWCFNSRMRPESGHQAGSFAPPRLRLWLHSYCGCFLAWLDYGHTPQAQPPPLMEKRKWGVNTGLFTQRSLFFLPEARARSAPDENRWCPLSFYNNIRGGGGGVSCKIISSALFLLQLIALPSSSIGLSNEPILWKPVNCFPTSTVSYCSERGILQMNVATMYRPAGLCMTERDAPFTHQAVRPHKRAKGTGNGKTPGRL